MKDIIENEAEIQVLDEQAVDAVSGGFFWSSYKGGLISRLPTPPWSRPRPRPLPNTGR